MVEILQRLAPMATRKVGNSAVGVSNGEFRVEFQRAVVVGNRAIEIALSLFGNSAPAVSDGEFRVEFQRAAVVGNRAVEIALATLAIPRLL